MVKNSLTNAGGMGSVPGSEKIQHAGDQLSSCTTVTESREP